MWYNKFKEQYEETQMVIKEKEKKFGIAFHSIINFVLNQVPSLASEKVENSQSVDNIVK